MKTEKQLHCGKEVNVNVPMDILRRKECLCLNCEYVTTCTWAKTLFDLCKTSNLALAVTRCPIFKKKETK